MLTKAERMAALVEKRKVDRHRMPPNAGIRDYHGGIYDQHGYVSPWSISAHNLDAKVMIFLQDWTSQDAISARLDEGAMKLGYTPTLPSNRNLINLCQNYLKVPIEQAYITNLFVFVKPGGMSATIPAADMNYSAVNYALPQIYIVQPKMVICLGSRTYNAMRRALGAKNVPLRDGLQQPALEYGTSKIYGVSHTGGLGVANAGGLSAVHKQWEVLSHIYRDI